MPQSGTGGASGARPNAFSRPVLPEALWQAGAAARSAANAMTFGGFDAALAAGGAVAKARDLSELGSQYGRALAAEKAKDAYDQAHRPIAHAAGEIGGTTLALMAGGPAEGVMAGAAGLARAQRLMRALELARAARTDARLAEATPATAREVKALLATGGALGVGNQAASDAVTGHRSGLKDDVAAGVGGLAGAAAAPFTGTGRASAVDSAVTSATQDLLAGRPIDIDRATRTARAGGLVGGAGGLVGRARVSMLPARAKGVLGERLGATRSAVNGEVREGDAKVKEYYTLDNRRYGTFADGRSGDIRMEDKFGASAKLSKGQQAARATLGDKFRVYHFLPRDVGKAVGVPAGDLAARLAAPTGSAFAPPPQIQPQRPPELQPQPQANSTRR